MSIPFKDSIDLNGNEILNARLTAAEFDNSASGTAKTIDWTKGNHQKVTMNGNCTFTFTPPTNPSKLQLRFINDATSGRTIAFVASTIKWQGGIAPVWTKVGGAIDILSLYYDGSYFYGVAALDWKY